MSLHKLRMCKRSDDPVATGVLLRNAALVRSLIDEGFPLTERACRNACVLGDLSMLQLLVENGCPLDLDRCLAVAAEERLKAWIKGLRTRMKHAQRRCRA